VEDGCPNRAVTEARGTGISLRLYEHDLWLLSQEKKTEKIEPKASIKGGTERETKNTAKATAIRWCNSILYAILFLHSTVQQKHILLTQA